MRVRLETRTQPLIRGIQKRAASPCSPPTGLAATSIRVGSTDGGLRVQHGLGSPPHADQHTGETKECEACGVARSGAADGAGTWVDGATVTPEPDVVLIQGPRISGRLVLPRQHIAGLDELPLPGRAQVLAAIRRAAGTVRGAEPSSSPRVVISTDPPASASHVCFHVLPPEGSRA